MQAKPRANAQRSAEITVSVVLPLYNEDRVLRTLERRVTEAIRACGCRPEIIFVNDGSQDASPAILDELAAAHAHVRVLHLSRNFGHQVALQAGLEHASGDVIIVMDADLQDDPASIPRLLACWQQGYDVVNAIRSGRKEGLLKKFLFFAFYRLLARVSAIPMPVDAGNFGLVDRRVGREIAQLMDRDRYYSGLRSWVGFKQIGIPVERESRYDARPRVSIRGLFRLAKNAIFSFSAVPLMIFYGIGMILDGGLRGRGRLLPLSQVPHRPSDPRLGVGDDDRELQRGAQRGGHRDPRGIRGTDLRPGAGTADVPGRAEGEFPRQ